MKVLVLAMIGGASAQCVTFPADDLVFSEGLHTMTQVCDFLGSENGTHSEIHGDDDACCVVTTLMNGTEVVSSAKMLFTSGDASTDSCQIMMHASAACDAEQAVARVLPAGTACAACPNTGNAEAADSGNSADGCVIQADGSIVNPQVYLQTAGSVVTCSETAADEADDNCCTVTNGNFLGNGDAFTIKYNFSADVCSFIRYDGPNCTGDGAATELSDLNLTCGECPEAGSEGDTTSHANSLQWLSFVAITVAAGLLV